MTNSPRSIDIRCGAVAHSENCCFWNYYVCMSVWLLWVSGVKVRGSRNKEKKLSLREATVHSQMKIKITILIHERKANNTNGLNLTLTHMWFFLLCFVSVRIRFQLTHVSFSYLSPLKLPKMVIKQEDTLTYHIGLHRRRRRLLLRVCHTGHYICRGARQNREPSPLLVQQRPCLLVDMGTE